MKFSSSAHLEAEHPLYDLIFGIKQSPKLGLANNKMAKNGLKRKNTVYQPYTDRIPTVYRPYTKESKENINVYQKKYHRIPSRIPKDKGTVYQSYTDRIPSVLPTNAKKCSINPIWFEVADEDCDSQVFCLERKRLASAKYRTAACFFGVLLIMYDLERPIRCFNNHTSHGAEHPLIFADKFQGYQKQFLVTLLHCT